MGKGYLMSRNIDWLVSLVFEKIGVCSLIIVDDSRLIVKRRHELLLLES